MPRNEQAKIAFVYSGVMTPGIAVGNPYPGLAIECKEFPSEHLLSVNFGVIGFNGIDNYSLDVKVLFNGEDVTAPPSSDKSVYAYTPQWGNDGEFVATMTIIESFYANAPGYYCIEATLLYKDTNPESLWEPIDIKHSFFSVAKEWRKNTDG